MAYTVCVALGVVAALLASRWLPRDTEIPGGIARTVRWAALLGAIAGAYLFELPADLLGWAAPVEPWAHPGSIALGGRTVVGGLLGGWIAVELAKWSRGYRGATGDRFAVPLAIGLAFGRIGCTLAGCCPGIPVARGTVWARLSVVHHDPPRFPATLIEAYFHALSALALVVMAHRGTLRGRRLALYLGVYAIVRIALERVRSNPPIAWGLTYYQWLSVPLGVLCAGVIAMRSRENAVESAAERRS